jgi:ribose transport system substrate-binding protein
MGRQLRLDTWRTRWIVLAVITLAGSLTVSTPASASAAPANPFGYKYGYKAAVAELSKLYAGTSTQVDPTSRPASENKFIVIISAGQASMSNYETVDAAAAAAQAIGWRAIILDGKLEPATYGGLVSEAVAEGANGIVLEGINCDQVEGPLEQAKARGTVVIPLDAYDCNDPTEDAGPPLFSAVPNIDNLPDKELGDVAEAYGRSQADYVIATSHDRARVLVLNDTGDTFAAYTKVGFDDQIAHSGGSRVVATVNFVDSDLGPRLEAEIRAALVQHPSINWIKSSSTYATTLGVVPAVSASARGGYDVMGGDGLQPELAAIGAGTVTAAVAISPGWLGWAAIDTMNSVFTHRPVYPSGIGWELIDATHNLPADGVLVPAENFEAAYEKAWGVKP